MEFKCPRKTPLNFEKDDNNGSQGDEELLAFNAKHLNEEIEGIYLDKDNHAKDKMKTHTVALVLCLNIDVDPPDTQKLSPCSRMEAWLDPRNKNSFKALEQIGNNLQAQYERWQPRARYKQCLDPTLDEVKKLCQNLRRNAKEDRVLFHYNGHGVPRPTENGEIWVFNKTFTKYIPLSIFDLQTWMGSPSVYVFDCNNAERIIKRFEGFCTKRLEETSLPDPDPSGSVRQLGVQPTSQPALVSVSMDTTIILAACSEQEDLPQSPDVPADLFTACLTTPILMAVRCYWLKCKDRFPGFLEEEMLNRIPGAYANRQSMLGELNWVFTAVTDTIAWSCLPMDLFQQLFRNDLLVASLFRNFLLAERIMRAYGATPVSHPPLPPTHNHPMWLAWDHALDNFLEQLPALVRGKESRTAHPLPILPHPDPAEQIHGQQGPSPQSRRHQSGSSRTASQAPGPDESIPYRHTTFFYNQLTAFQVWLNTADDRKPPALQLPILLQVLLSQVHRIRALELLSQYVDLGRWAVAQSLSVGIFPYMVRLLQSPVPEVKPLLVFIWCKIIASAETDFARNEVVKEYGYRYFMSCLTESDRQEPRTRTMASFLLTKMLENNRSAQEILLKENLMSVISNQLDDNPPDLDHNSYVLMRLWLILCLSKLWHQNDQARWVGVRSNIQEELYPYLKDVSPLVRAATVLALGSFMDNREEQGRSDHANQIDHQVATHLIQVSALDASPLVRKELVVAFAGLVRQFEPQFVAMGYQYMEEMRVREEDVGSPARHGSVDIRSVPIVLNARAQTYRHSIGSISPAVMPRVRSIADLQQRLDDSSGVRRVGSSSNFFSGGSSVPFGNIYVQLWRCLMTLSRDPFPEVANMAKTIVGGIRNKIFEKTQQAGNNTNTIPRAVTSRLSARHSADAHSAPGSPSQSPSRRGSRFILSNFWQSPPRQGPTASPAPIMIHSAIFPSRRQQADLPPASESSASQRTVTSSQDSMETNSSGLPAVRTDLIPWCARWFVRPHLRTCPEEDPQFAPQLLRAERFDRQTRAGRHAREDWIAASLCGAMPGQLHQMFVQKNPHRPVLLRLHPYQPHLTVADKGGVSIWDYASGQQVQYLVARSSSGGGLVGPGPGLARVTALELMNTAEERGLVMAGSDDGTVRVWRNYYPDLGQDPEIVTAWLALTDMLQSNRSAGLVTQWWQVGGQLAVSGDVKVVRLWDSTAEARVCDLPTLADSCVTCLDRSHDGRLVAAGFGDGMIRLFDVRAPSGEGVMGVTQGDKGWIHTVKFSEGGDCLYSAGHNGQLTCLEIQYRVPLATCAAAHRRDGLLGGLGVKGLVKLTATRPPVPKAPVHAADIQACGPSPDSHLVALGLGVESRELIVAQGRTGLLHSTLKFYDGFSRENIATPTCVSFHPKQPMLAMGLDDNLILLLSLKPSK